MGLPSPSWGRKRTPDSAASPADFSGAEPDAQGQKFERPAAAIKFFEFFASGKPVVVSELPALRDFFDKVRVARNPSEFIAQCEQAVRDPDTGREQRIALAANNTWEHRVERLMAQVERRLS